MYANIVEGENEGARLRASLAAPGQRLDGHNGDGYFRPDVPAAFSYGRWGSPTCLLLFKHRPVQDYVNGVRRHRGPCKPVVRGQIVAVTETGVLEFGPAHANVLGVYFGERPLYRHPVP
jgi:hypothetical protein